MEYICLVPVDRFKRLLNELCSKPLIVPEQAEVYLGRPDDVLGEVAILYLLGGWFCFIWQVLQS